MCRIRKEKYVENWCREKREKREERKKKRERRREKEERRAFST